MIIFAIRLYDLNQFTFIMPLYSISGVTAAILFAVTLIPGSMQRLKFGKPIYALLIYYRRQIGTFMYVIAVFHMTTQLSRHFLFNPAVSLFYDPIIIAGSLSLIVLFPVYLTSNNYSMKLLKRNWKTIQRITYISFFFITWHLYLVGHYILFYFYLLVAVFIVLSWIYTFLDRSELFDKDEKLQSIQNDLNINNQNERLQKDK